MLVCAFPFSGGFGKLVHVTIGLKLSMPTTVMVGYFYLMERDSFKAPFIVQCDRYVILAFSRFRLDAINLNSARSVSRNQNSYLSVTKLHKISRKSISL